MASQERERERSATFLYSNTATLDCQGKLVREPSLFLFAAASRLGCCCCCRGRQPIRGNPGDRQQRRLSTWVNVCSIIFLELDDDDSSGPSLAKKKVKGKCTSSAPPITFPFVSSFAIGALMEMRKHAAHTPITAQAKNRKTLPTTTAKGSCILF